MKATEVHARIDFPSRARVAFDVHVTGPAAGRRRRHALTRSPAVRRILLLSLLLLALTAAPATADKSTATIQCPTRGAFGNGPTYYSQFYEDYILGYVFKDQKSGFYVDVGANDPDKSSVTKYFYLAGWRGINIEPIPELVEKLNQSRPEDTNKGVAISDKPGELTFYKGVGDASGLSTLSRPPRALTLSAIPTRP